MYDVTKLYSNNNLFKNLSERAVSQWVEVKSLNSTYHHEKLFFISEGRFNVQKLDFCPNVGDMIYGMYQYSNNIDGDIGVVVGVFIEHDPGIIHYTINVLWTKTK